MAFNLSEWALKHRSFVVYLMLVAVGRAPSVKGLGLDEIGLPTDPRSGIASVLQESANVNSVAGADGFFRTFPSEHGTDGFFAAVLTRKETTAT